MQKTPTYAYLSKKLRKKHGCGNRIMRGLGICSLRNVSTPLWHYFFTATLTKLEQSHVVLPTFFHSSYLFMSHYLLSLSLFTIIYLLSFLIILDSKLSLFLSSYLQDPSSNKKNPTSIFLCLFCQWFFGWNTIIRVGFVWKVMRLQFCAPFTMLF